VTESSSTALAPAATWWSPDPASTSPEHVIDPVQRLVTDNPYHPGSCVWAPLKDHDGLNHHYHVLSDDNWPSNVDDLLPMSETYKWMTVRRSRTKTGTVFGDIYQLCPGFSSVQSL